MAHRAKILHGERTIRMHYANCATFNADFDGDEINLHLPQEHQGRAEGYHIVHADHQFKACPLPPPALRSAPLPFASAAHSLPLPVECASDSSNTRSILCAVSPPFSRPLPVTPTDLATALCLASATAPLPVSDPRIICALSAQYMHGSRRCVSWLLGLIVTACIPESQPDPEALCRSDLTCSVTTGHAM